MIKEKLNLSSLIIYQSFINYLLSSTLRSIKIIEEYPSFKISLDRVEELFMIKEEEFKNNYFYLPYNLEGDIIIKNLNYKIGYKDLFKDLNLTIKQGEKILLTGPSGCGKSTLVKMLMRYVEVNFNIINIANIDINHYHLNNIRTNITYVSSNEYLFNDTLKNNPIKAIDDTLIDLPKTKDTKKAVDDFIKSQEESSILNERRDFHIV